MPQDYTIEQGDCIDKVAAQFGFFPDTLWNHADNAALKEQRKDPNVLMPGDILKIPDLRVKQEDGATEKRHKFKRKGVPAKLRLCLLKPKEPEPPEDEAAPTESGDGDESAYEDPEEEAKAQEMEPRKNVPYILEIDGVRGEPGETDGEGRIEESLPPKAREGRLILNPGTAEEEIIPLQLGGMDPVDTITGARKRLVNLGHHCSLDGDAITPELREVLLKFQKDNSLETSGEIDQATQDKLKELHGC